MKVSKRALRRMIREEKRKMGECGHDEMMSAPSVAVVAEPALGALVSETMDPEEQLMVEMAMANRALEQVVESVQNAADLCPECVSGVAAQAPLMEAVVSKAEALQEMIEAQAVVVAESVDGAAPEAVDIVGL